MIKNNNRCGEFIWKVTLYTLLGLLLLAIVVAIVFLFIDLFTNYLPERGNRTDGSMEKFYFLATVLVTGLIACIAYFQLHGINQTASNDFMFRILKLYQSSEILKARQIIHKVHLSVNTRPAMPKEEIRGLISNKLLEIKMDKKNKESAEEFVYLNNLLELMEDLSYYANHNLINKETVAGLKSGSILYFYDVFKDLILDRRKQDFGYYSEFETLANYLKSNKCK